MDTTLDPLLKLPRAERIQLVEDLWDSIAREDSELPVLDSHREELQRAVRSDSLHVPPRGALGKKSSSMRDLGMINKIIYIPDAEEDIADSYD